MTVLSSGDVLEERVLDVTGLFNPVDCQSLGVIRTTLKTMAPGMILTVISNRFQKREIESWAKKFRHLVLSINDIEGRVTIRIQKGDSG